MRAISVDWLGVLSIVTAYLVIHGYNLSRPFIHLITFHGSLHEEVWKENIHAVLYV
jgi:hypothetical protein